MINEEILLIITNELTEQASEGEKDILKDWLAESRGNSSLYHSYKEAFLNGKYELKAKNKNDVYTTLSGRLGFENANTKNNEKIIPSHQISRGWLKIAATILILITSSLVIYQTRYYWIPTQKIIASNTMIVKSNPAGVKSLVTLPDGSHVKLNSESHLEYSANFEQDRSVKLIGEAFFEVVKDTLRPFVVKAGDLSIRVMGTSFNVEAFPFEKNIKVALVTGSVLIEKEEGLERKPVEYLHPSEMLVYDHQSSGFNVTQFDYSEVLGWKDGELHFVETDFIEVVKKLERWYGVEILVSSKADMSGRFNGTYNDESLEVVLEGMGFTSDFDFEIKGKNVYIK